MSDKDYIEYLNNELKATNSMMNKLEHDLHRISAVAKDHQPVLQNMIRLKRYRTLLLKELRSLNATETGWKLQ